MDKNLQSFAPIRYLAIHFTSNSPHDIIKWIRIYNPLLQQHLEIRQLKVTKIRQLKVTKINTKYINNDFKSRG